RRSARNVSEKPAVRTDSCFDASLCDVRHPIDVNAPLCAPVQRSMKHNAWIVLVAAAPALLLGDQKATCPLGPFDLRSPREQQAALYHKLSVATEAVAPSRHRAVEPPK